MKKKLKYIGENIRQARNNKNLTIERLAELADISESFLGLVERGVSGLSLENVINIAKILDVTTDSLIVEKSLPSETPTFQDTLITLIRNSTEAEAEFLLDFVKLYQKRGLFSKDS